MKLDGTKLYQSMKYNLKPLLSYLKNVNKLYMQNID